MKKAVVTIGITEGELRTSLDNYFANLGAIAQYEDSEVIRLMSELDRYDDVTGVIKDALIADVLRSCYFSRRSENV